MTSEGDDGEILHAGQGDLIKVGEFLFSAPGPNTFRYIFHLNISRIVPIAITTPIEFITLIAVSDSHNERYMIFLFFFLISLTSLRK